MSTTTSVDECFEKCIVCGVEILEDGNYQNHHWSKGEVTCIKCVQAADREKFVKGVLKDPFSELSSRGVPKRYQACRFDNYRTNAETLPVVDQLKSIDESFVESVFLTSKTSGTGKTHLSVALMFSLLAKGFQSIKFISSPYLFLDIKNSFSAESGESEKEVIQRYCNIGFLIVDDIGVEKVTDWAMQIWYMIIDSRHSQMKPTLFTSNLSVGDIAANLGTRVASRISSGYVHTLTGLDYRLKNRPQTNNQ